MRSVCFAALMGLLAGGLTGCAQERQAVATQKDSTWVKTDPAAINAAQPEKAPDIRAKTHFAAGQLFEQQRAYSKAVGQYLAALQRDPDYLPALTRLGMLYGRLGRHTEAEQTLRKAVQVRPEAAVLHNNLGFEYLLQQRWADGEAALRRALALQPDFARARVNLGLALVRRERYADAVAEFRQILPEPDAYYNLGLLLRSLHRPTDAAKAFELALDLDPDFVAARTQIQQLEPQVAKTNDREPKLNAVEWQSVVCGRRSTIAEPPQIEATALTGVEAAAAEFVAEDLLLVEPAQDDLLTVEAIPAESAARDVATPTDDTADELVTEVEEITADLSLTLPEEDLAAEAAIDVTEPVDNAVDEPATDIEEIVVDLPPSVLDEDLAAEAAIDVAEPAGNAIDEPVTEVEEIVVDLPPDLLGEDLAAQPPPAEAPALAPIDPRGARLWPQSATVEISGLSDPIYFQAAGQLP